MSTETISFEIPKELLASLNTGVQNLTRELRILGATSYFQEKKLSLGKAAELAGIPRLEFMDFLFQKGIVVFDYDEEELEIELEGIKVLKGIVHDH